MVIAPGTVGEVGILPLHMPLVTTLKIGELRLKTDKDTWSYFAIDGGYLEVREDNVTILADAAEFASKIDVGELIKTQAELKERLAGMKSGATEFYELSHALERVANRLRVAEKR